MKDLTSFKCGSGTRDPQLLTTRGWVRAHSRSSPRRCSSRRTRCSRFRRRRTSCGKPKCRIPSAALGNRSTSTTVATAGGASRARTTGTTRWTGHRNRRYLRAPGVGAACGLERAVPRPLARNRLPGRLQHTRASEAIDGDRNLPGLGRHANHMDGDRERRNDDRARVPVHHLQSDHRMARPPGVQLEQKRDLDSYRAGGRSERSSGVGPKRGVGHALRRLAGHRVLHRPAMAGIHLSPGLHSTTSKQRAVGISSRLNRSCNSSVPLR